MSELLTYKNILNDIKNFRQAGTAYDEANDKFEFNMFDTPSHKYFKILFYFGSVPEMYATDTASGLLAPTWEYFKNQNLSFEDRDISKTDYYNYNSAWAYLKLNNEEERAEKLEHFVTLLSDINSNSPWYFHSISGIDSALERKSVEDGKLDVSENKKITITCLPDAYDNRIGTLLDLYRDVTWSWVQKKEIIPANLRKFDMAVYMFESTINNLHKENDIIGSESGYKVSYKMLEFHDCEFNYNSVKTGWTEINNEAGFSPKYTIDISYNDCYEISYNDIMMRKIGDVILTDLLNSPADIKYESYPQKDNNMLLSELKSRAFLPKFEDIQNNQEDYKAGIKISYLGNLGERTGKPTEDININTKYEYQPGFLTNASGQFVGHFVKDTTSLFTKAVLGNIHTYSLTQIGNQLAELSEGNLIKSGMTAGQYIRQAEQRYENRNPKKPSGDIFPNVEVIHKKPIGNIFSKKTLANNI
jgi:hypothetical protein